MTFGPCRYQFIKMPAYQFDWKPAALSLFPKITKAAVIFTIKRSHRAGEVSWHTTSEGLRAGVEEIVLVWRSLQHTSKRSLCPSILEGGDENKSCSVMSLSSSHLVKGNMAEYFSLPYLLLGSHSLRSPQIFSIRLPQKATANIEPTSQFI